MLLTCFKKSKASKCYHYNMSFFEFLTNINSEQFIVFTVIFLVVVLLTSKTLRYDLISIFTLLLIVLTGVLSVDKTFSGLTHPVVLLVIAMFIITRGLSNSGLIDYITRKISILNKHPIIQITILTTIVALASAFINNIGALAPVIPIAVHLARKNNLSPAIFLMPLAFGSQLGGYLTLIGTPRNIIVSTFREEAGLDPFGMFDFALVGGFLALIGILFLSFIGWRLLPRKISPHSNETFSVENYVTEVNVSKNSKLVGEKFASINGVSQKNISLVSIARDGVIMKKSAEQESILKGDHLIIRADSESLKNFTEEFRVNLTGERAIESQTPADERVSLEVMVTPSSPLVGKTWDEVPLSLRYGVNLLAVSRSTSEINTPLNNIRFRAGDVVILYGKNDTVEKTISDMDCYPLAERKLTLGQPSTISLALTIFMLAILTATLTSAPVEIIFLIAAFIMVLTNLVPLKQAYASIQWPVIILIGSMITLGLALQETGGADLIATLITSFSTVLTPAVLVLVILILSILIANFINATIAAVIMAPIAIFVATGLSVSVDPYLMAVAIGATSVFMTSFGHESNTLVMEAGGYTFKDYLKVGLPLEILIIVTSVPLILYFWPL